MNCYTSRKLFGDGAQICVQKIGRKNNASHTHEFIEIVYIKSGESVHEIDGIKYNVKKGDLLFINYGSNHSIHSEGSIEYYNVLFTPAFLSEDLTNSRNAFDLLLLSSFENFSQISGQLKFSYSGEDLLQIERIITNMHIEYKNKETGYIEVLKSYMTILMTKIFRKMESDNVISEKTKIPAEMLEYIETHYCEKINLNTLAGRCFYNPSYFSRIFKETYGVTLTQYIAEKRFYKAQELLKTSKLTVEEIAIMSGYKDTAAIYKHFKTKLGITPHEFRNK